MRKLNASGYSYSSPESSKLCRPVLGGRTRHTAGIETPLPLHSISLQSEGEPLFGSTAGVQA